ncbi:hypothetical protein A2526_04915 [candidate division WOR-1 bacterium RIFOXYD2_FULL_36_8]|uniref:Uncharacterized protein n=1 Tax=candidate division WOR-1 bacterium RIFOXYB2_FULL_36_35 TaxID=1802578 RepID=A0A1F4S2N7_UNCSA|nr:MAG: hypothetical protein A2230_04425 [candidate division WOR-1 bacterium RIFOXYA2_FULL_36_21]OGC14639.1 MAG: hypothetical protein A2290_01155 [candidate division WOR-1 bacterium RIFOXYB2_FULL_36_35]OGC19657.1 MAG: hypothetical protein A2282_02880 [candidate division WOR-1 bacterium RIFOXYA12_FULL_36_13]OGC41381.1 MAG: hypothetical protein A2526_04915 [candidate division WOR-1 bacterium RIFOXYD2_FULL_36_8]
MFGEIKDHNGAAINYIFTLITSFFIIIFLLMGNCFAEDIIRKIDFDNANVLDVVGALALQAGLDIVLPSDPSSQKKVTLHLRNVNPSEAIDYILKTNGFTCEKKGNSILVSTLPQDLSQTGYERVYGAIELKYLSADKVSTILNKILPNLSVIVGGMSNRLIVGGKESEVSDAKRLIQKIDLPVPQILLEGQVVEISKSDSVRMGVDYNNGIFRFINEDCEDIRSTINALISKGEAHVVASPRIATLDNCEAVINIGSRIPYAVPVSSTSTSTQWTIEYIDAGVKLKITPQLGKDSQIVMTLAPEVSSISEWRTTPAGEFPVISTRNASATLKTKNGEMIVVGGLDSETERTNVAKVPILGQIPILGLLFQNKTVEKAKTEIVFMITPYVI